MLLTMNKIIFFLLVSFAVTVHAGVTAKSYLVTDTQGQVVIEKDADQPRPIASITKLMTIIVVLDSRQPLDDVIILDYKLSRQYHTHLPRGVKTLTRQDLIDLAMVKSDNFAAYTLCANYPGGVDSCIDAMNLKATNLGMTNTHYTDPTGLEETNISTARDLIKLIISAKSYPNIVSATRPSVEIKVKKHWYQAFNTSPIVRLHDDDIIVSKTGYIHQSGGCLVMLMNTQLGQRIIALLGSRNAHTRFLEAEELIKS
jgi:D-alanyl-D-alanine endopeptidase (penicillin-binding protein 7)